MIEKGLELFQVTDGWGSSQYFDMKVSVFFFGILPLDDAGKFYVVLYKQSGKFKNKHRTL